VTYLDLIEVRYLELPAGSHADFARLTARRLGVVFTVTVVAAVFVTDVTVTVALTANTHIHL